MRILATGNRGERQRGLTLVELLVVLIVMGLMAGVVMLSLPSKPSAAAQTAKVFADEVTSLMDRAVIGGRPMGLDVTEQGWTAMVFQDGDWRMMAGITPAGEGLGLNLSVADQFQLPEEDRATTFRLLRTRKPALAAPSPAPPLTFDPVGEGTAFVLTIAGREEVWAVEGDRFGHTRVFRVEG